MMIAICDDDTKPHAEQNVIELKPWLTLGDMRAYWRMRFEQGFHERAYSRGEEEILIFTVYVARMYGPWLDTITSVLDLPYGKTFVQRAIERAVQLHTSDPVEPIQPSPNP